MQQKAGGAHGAQAALQRKAPYRQVTRRFVPSRAENGTRTRDPDLGKVVLYQLSYFRIAICRLF